LGRRRYVGLVNNCCNRGPGVSRDPRKQPGEDQNMKITRPAVLGMLGAVSLAAPGVALSQTVEGVIVANTGSSIVVRTEGADTTYNVSDSTKIRGTGGILDSDPFPPAALMPGLAVKVKTSDDGETSVKFKKHDYRIAAQINAGLHGTNAMVASNAAGIQSNASAIASNSDRINNVGELMSAGRTKVFFDLGSTKLSSQGEQDLQAIAAQAKGMKSYRLVVVGRADPTGGENANQKLSDDRAAAVTQYLLKKAGVGPERILTPAAVGESEVTQDPDPPATAQEARRVTVTIAVSKAVAQQ
jgi:outer membrane protein OmpA-like peptidoglycan-associated protein